MQNNEPFEDSVYIIDSTGEKIYVKDLQNHLDKKKEELNERRLAEANKRKVRELGSIPDGLTEPDKLV